MDQTTEQQLLCRIRKYSSLTARGILSPSEFTHGVFNQFARLDRVYPEVIPALWELVPQVIEIEFATAIRHATAPGYRYRSYFINGLEPITDEELQDDDMRTVRVQAWAAEFVRFWHEVGVDKGAAVEHGR